MARRPARSFCLASAAVAVALLASCKGPVNASPELRWWLFSNFGATQICPALLGSGVPLRLRSDAPAIGRYFPSQCSVQVDHPSHTVTVNISGNGYGFTPLSRRIGFSVTASVEYRPDFRLWGDDVYVWGVFNRTVYGPDFRVTHAEAGFGGVGPTPFGGLANYVGDQVVRSGLMRGFTVVHRGDRGSEFALDVLQPPRRPPSPFHLGEGGLYTFANETVEVHPGQRDYLGPFQVAEAGQRLVMRYALVGPPAEVLVVARATGDAWRYAYQGGEVGPPPGPVLAGGPLPSGATVQTSYRLPPGSYYVVVDHTAQAGVVHPPGGALGVLGPPIQLSYVAQLAED